MDCSIGRPRTRSLYIRHCCRMVGTPGPRPDVEYLRRDHHQKDRLAPDRKLPASAPALAPAPAFLPALAAGRSRCPHCPRPAGRAPIPALALADFAALRPSRSAHNAPPCQFPSILLSVGVYQMHEQVEHWLSGTRRFSPIHLLDKHYPVIAAVCSLIMVVGHEIHRLAQVARPGV